MLVLFHSVLAVAHLGQSLAQFIIASLREPINVPITRTGTNISSGVPPWSPLATRSVSYYAPVQPMFFIASFPLITAIFHAATAFGYHKGWIWTFADKPEDLKDKKVKSSTIRWMEYSITSTIMVVNIMLISDVSDLYALILGAICNYSMILFGHFSDEFRFLALTKANVGYNVKASWIAGCVAGAGPWIVIWTSLASSGLPLTSTVGAIVYSATATTMSLFFSFAFVSFFYSWQKGGCLECWRSKASDYKPIKNDTPSLPKYEEVIYPILSAVAKSLLAWLVFGALLQS